MAQITPEFTLNVLAEDECLEIGNIIVTARYAQISNPSSKSRWLEDVLGIRAPAVEFKFIPR